MTGMRYHTHTFSTLVPSFVDLPSVLSSQRMQCHSIGGGLCGRCRSCWRPSSSVAPSYQKRRVTRSSTNVQSACVSTVAATDTARAWSSTSSISRPSSSTPSSSRLRLPSSTPLLCSPACTWLCCTPSSTASSHPRD